MTVDAIMDVIKENPFHGVTFSGGDPLYQQQGFTELARRIKTETDKDIWCFTGFTWEELTGAKEFLQYIDVLVDGPFVQALRDEELLFRGSSNQRLIDVQKSLGSGKVILWEREL